MLVVVIIVTMLVFFVIVVVVVVVMPAFLVPVFAAVVMLVLLLVLLGALVKLALLALERTGHFAVAGRHGRHSLGRGRRSDDAVGMRHELAEVVRRLRVHLAP